MSAAAATAVSASISTPVCAVVSAAAVTVTPSLVEHRVDLDHRERERMAQRHDVGRPLGGHDAGEPGGGEDVALGERPGRDPLAHVLGQRDVPAGDSPAPGRRLPAHVDHPDLTHAREVYGVRYRIGPGHALDANPRQTPARAGPGQNAGRTKASHAAGRYQVWHIRRLHACGAAVTLRR